MTELQSQMDRMKAAGFVTATEAAPLIGRSPGGNIPGVLEKHGVSSIVVECVGKNPVRMYLRSDLSKVPIPQDEKLPGGINNGGKLSHRVKEMEEAFIECRDGIQDLNEKLDALLDLLATDKKHVNGKPMRRELAAT